jgi:hypothetical protein
MHRQLKPYSQGALDGLCGVHAIINALYVLYPDMKKKQAQRLFRKLIKEIARRGALKVIWRGMDGTLFRHLLVQAADCVARRRKVSIKVARPFASGPVELPDLVQSLNGRIGNGCIAITMMREKIWHWTVVIRVTEKTVFLFDSDGVNSIRIENCSVHKSGKRYQLNARETVFLGGEVE